MIEQPLAAGDILCTDSNAGPGVHLDYARTHARFSSRIDVVVGILNGKAITLGGNVTNSMRAKKFALDASAKVIPGHNLYALMKKMTP